MVGSMWIKLAACMAAVVVGSARAQDPPAAPDAAANESPAQSAEQPRSEGGLVEFLAARFSPLEPMYFIGGTEQPNIKFQLSLKYQLFGEQGSLAQAAPWIGGFYLGYSQTSFWDISSDSRPFFDSSYRPEALDRWEQHDPHWLVGMRRFDVQAGLKHESNGKAGADSRSLNIAYVQPVLTFGDPGYGGKGFFVAVAPRIWGYIFSLSNNPDIAEYRGYGDLRLITGWRGGLQLDLIGRMGNDWDKGALEADVSYPLRKLTGGNLDLYVYAQVFTGYGESLLRYNDSDTNFRLGVALVR
jgi:outer membrane phospholipase A